MLKEGASMPGDFKDILIGHSNPPLIQKKDGI
ncbi:hypothetical protein METP1_03075 [Methanosarcinales archaeon]|nr:hypothetical protein METP1_03075 [Methanosarcinales archaeon]